ncbi:hypothetical protein T484DRAFT_1890240, partial [Baffinella frigidus]
MAKPEGIEFDYASSFARVVDARRKRLPAALPKQGGGQGYDAAPAVAAFAVRSGERTPRGASPRDEVPWIKAGRLPAATLPAPRQPVMREKEVDSAASNRAEWGREASEPPERRALQLPTPDSSPEKPSLPPVAVHHHHHHMLPPPELQDRAWSTPLDPQPTDRKETALAQSTQRSWSAAPSDAGGWRGGQASARKSARRAAPTVLQQWAAKNQGTARLRPTGGAAAPWVAPGATPGGAEELCLECNLRFEAAFAAGEGARCSAMLQSARQLVERGLVLDSPGPANLGWLHARLGDAEQAHDAFARALTVAEQLAMPLAAASAHVHLSGALLARGDDAPAFVHAQAAAARCAEDLGIASMHSLVTGRLPRGA